MLLIIAAFYTFVSICKLLQHQTLTKFKKIIIMSFNAEIMRSKLT